MLLHISRTLEGEEYFAIKEAKLAPIEDGGKKLFTSLDYKFREPDSKRVAACPSYPLYHFYLEGDICIEAISVGYEVLLEVKE